MALARFVVRRVAGGVVFALAVASLTLVLARLAPGDATTLDPDIPPEEREALRAALGLDQPLLTQYGRWLSGLARFDLGHSSRFNRPVADLVGQRAINTAVLALAALIVASLVGIPLGRFTGAHRGWLARVVRGVSIAVLSVPPLLSALGLVFLAARTGWLPVGGMTSGGLTGTAWLADLARHLPVPMLALALPLAATLERVQSRAMTEAVGRPFVNAARARGLTPDRTLRVHAWPVSLAPVLGTYGVLVGALFSGSFVVEIDHLVARARPAAPRGAEQPRRVAGGRLRGHRRGVAGGGHDRRRRGPRHARPAHSRRAPRLMRRALLLLAVIVGTAVAGPFLAPYGATERFPDHLHAPPMGVHVDGGGLYAHPLTLVDRLEQRFTADTSRRVPLPWSGRDGGEPVFLLGADSMGRDVLSRMLHGARASLGLALVATSGTLLVGALLGVWAGYARGVVERGVMVVGDLLMVLPMLYVVVALRATLPLVLPLGTVVLVMAAIFVLLGWPRVARGVRAIVHAETDREHIDAAVALGASRWRVMTRHLLPACLGYLAVQTALLVPLFVLTEATLSYVGLGFPDGVPSWGTALSDAANLAGMTRAPWTLAPAAAIFLVVLVTNVLLEPSRQDPVADVSRSG